MSLDWDYGDTPIYHMKKMENSPFHDPPLEDGAICLNDRMHALRDSIIWASIPCGFGLVDNTAIKRLLSYQEALHNGTFFSLDHPPAAEWELRLFMGLRTNASKKTATEFKKYVKETLK